MILVRAPLRIPLGGGGTDLPSYYSKFGGNLVSIAINKYVYVKISNESEPIAFDYGWKEIDNPYFYESLNFLKIKEALSARVYSDIPEGTGLGGSGAFLVALLKALCIFSGKKAARKEIAELAFEVEANRLKKPVGKQDHYLAAHGGLVNLQIHPSGRVRVIRPGISNKNLKELLDSFLVFYTGIQRESASILKLQTKLFKGGTKKAVEGMHALKDVGVKILKALEDSNIKKIGELMDLHWQYKKNILKETTTSEIDKWYQIGKNAGALGGKIMGAGGGGYLLFCALKKRNNVRKAMLKEGLREVRFKLDSEGAKEL